MKLSFSAFFEKIKNCKQFRNLNFEYLFDEKWWEENYKNKRTKIKFKYKDIILEQSVAEHLNCRIPKKIKNYKTFIEIKNILNNKFKNFNFLINEKWWQENYKGFQTKIPFKYQNKLFYRPLKELLTRNFIRISILTYKDFLKKAKEIHGDKYDYSLITEEWWRENYFRIKETIIPIICPKHGMFEQSVFLHLRGHGCQKCGIEKSTYQLNEKKKLTFKNFKKRFNKIHKNLIINFDEKWWEENYKNTYTKVPIICPKHGIFESKINSILNGVGCPKCKESKGERKIRHYLEENNINYEYQYPIKIKNHKKPLYFDFYLPKQNIAIEFDGIFHYKDHPKQSVEIQKKRDELKNQYCKENNIKLIRIPYWEYDSIEKILKRELN